MEQKLQIFFSACVFGILIASKCWLGYVDIQRWLLDNVLSRFDVTAQYSTILALTTRA